LLPRIIYGEPVRVVRDAIAVHSPVSRSGTLKHANEALEARPAPTLGGRTVSREHRGLRASGCPAQLN
jgi:hypothetical protein